MLFLNAKRLKNCIHKLLTIGENFNNKKTIASCSITSKGLTRCIAREPSVRSTLVHSSLVEVVFEFSQIEFGTKFSVGEQTWWWRWWWFTKQILALLLLLILVHQRSSRFEHQLHQIGEGCIEGYVEEDGEYASMLHHVHVRLDL